ncbi:hypothetical protein TWF281_011593 [Arthrobotrys megalospora]
MTGTLMLPVSLEENTHPPISKLLDQGSITGSDTNRSILHPLKTDVDPRAGGAFSGTPYVETWDIYCQSPAEVVEHWRSRSIPEELANPDPDFFFGWDLHWNFGQMAVHQAMELVESRQFYCYFCSCTTPEAWGVGSQAWGGLLFPNLSEECELRQTSNACYHIFKCRCDKVFMTKEEAEGIQYQAKDPFSNINQGHHPVPEESLELSSISPSELDLLWAEMETMLGTKLGDRQDHSHASPVGHSGRMLIPGTKEPYYLEGPGEKPIQPPPSSGMLGGKGLPPTFGFKAKRSLDRGGSRTPANSAPPPTGLDIPVDSSVALASEVNGATETDAATLPPADANIDNYPNPEPDNGDSPTLQ